MNTQLIGKVEAEVWEVKQGEITQLKINDVVFQVVEQQPEQEPEVKQPEKPIQIGEDIWSEKYKFFMSPEEIKAVRNAVNLVGLGYKPTNLNIIKESGIKPYRFNAIIGYLKKKQNLKTQWDKDGDYIYYFGK